MSRIQLDHKTLETKFIGNLHPLSSEDTPVVQYLGIKYASIPARFRQSKIFSSYLATTDATRYGPICPQIHCKKTFEEELFGLADADIPKQILKQNEFECLNLNITCPAGITRASRLPVMLWIHGGGDRGSGSNWVYDGYPLVSKSMLDEKPIILITFNFRIGLFGFAASHSIREDNEAAGDKGVGNYGLRDQRKALEWIHRFIAEFGGDPSNITLFGESTGAADVICHLLSASNQTRPLFQRAIVQSAVFDFNLPDCSSVGWQLSRIMSSLGAHSLGQFRAASADKLASVGFGSRAMDDGVFFRKGWMESILPEDAHLRHHHVESHLQASVFKSRPASPSRPSQVLHLPANLQPLIIGDCSYDSFLWSTPASLWSPAGVARRTKAVCQSLSKTSALLNAYDISAYTPHDDESVERVLELVNDARVAWPTECLAVATKKERGGRGVWRYVFDQEGPIRCIPHHAADLVYLFDTVPLPESAQPSACPDFYEGGFAEHFESDDEDEDLMFNHDSPDKDSVDEDWALTPVDEWSYARVRDAIQGRWIAFANGEAPWRQDKVFVFGPEGETGERSEHIFEGRRRREMWKEALEPLGIGLVQKVGLELSRGPPLAEGSAVEV